MCRTCGTSPTGVPMALWTNWALRPAVLHLRHVPARRSFSSFVSPDAGSVLGQIDTITPGAGAHTDLTLAPFTNIVPPVQIGNVNAATSPGGVGLIYTETPVAATGGTGQQSRLLDLRPGRHSAPSSTGRRPLFKPNPDIYKPRNVRQGIIHNIVSYLRTGTITGTIRSTSGNGVGGLAASPASPSTCSRPMDRLQPFPDAGPSARRPTAAGNYRH